MSCRVHPLHWRVTTVSSRLSAWWFWNWTFLCWNWNSEGDLRKNCPLAKRTANHHFLFLIPAQSQLIWGNQWLVSSLPFVWQQANNPLEESILCTSKRKWNLFDSQMRPFPIIELAKVFPNIERSFVQQNVNSGSGNSKINHRHDLKMTWHSQPWFLSGFVNSLK